MLLKKLPLKEFVRNIRSGKPMKKVQKIVAKKQPYRNAAQKTAARNFRQNYS